MKKFLSTLIAAVCVITCAFSFTACGGSNGTHTHNWSSAYTQDGDRHYQTCVGCNEKQYGNHDYGTSGVCICGKQKPADTVAVTEVTLNKNMLTLEVGGTETLTATVAPNNATDKAVTWESDKTNIATVNDSGKVTAIAEGTAVITVTAANNKTAQCTVTVSAAVIPVTGVTLDKTELTLEVDETEMLTATVSPEDATDKTVSWSSDKTNIVTVDNSGKITAVAAGTAVITATAVNNKTATCTVTVNAPITNAQVLAALDANYKEAVGKSCFPNSFKYDKTKVSNEKWYVTTNEEDQIVSVNYGFDHVTDDGNGYYALAEVNFESPVNVKDLIEGKITNAAYNRLYRVNYNANIQDTRKDLTDAICEKAFVTNGTVQNRYIIVGSLDLGDDECPKKDEPGNKCDMNARFQLIEVTDKCINIASVVICAEQNVKSNDEFLVKKLQDNHYSLKSLSSINITGTHVENNNEPFANGTKEN